MRRFTRILCPIDFSDISSHALEHALAFARWYDAAVTGLFVYTPVYATTPGVGMYAYGAPPLPADLVVVGSHGTTGFEHVMLGSIAERVLRTCPAPVLTVPPRATVTSRLPMKRVLCPVDFSEPAKAAVRVALSIAQEGDAEITILHVADVPRDEPLTTRPIATPEFYAEYEAAAREQLDALLADGAGDWCRPRTLIRHGKAYREILAEAAASSADLIVIGVHGRNPLDLMLFGSTTNQVVRRATCPVLTVRS